MFCVLKNPFKVVLSNEHPKETQIEELGGGRLWKVVFVMLQS